MNANMFMYVCMYVRTYVIHITNSVHTHEHARVLLYTSTALSIHEHARCSTVLEWGTHVILELAGDFHPVSNLLSFPAFIVGHALEPQVL